ncbi:autophagy-related protein 23-like [Pollicipes pollicipes]|uniref:autophagy-related protein 23-like n=1 Tax=Pollicipes pollicipes TaxID=41117 RepID=UPI00188527FB|nr:autophagy-related protein 23-like [Pollicipes pollicipes]
MGSKEVSARSFWVATLNEHVGSRRPEIEEDAGSEDANEIRVLKERRPPPPPPPPPAAGPDHTVVLWLQETVTTLKRQLAELAESVNTTQLLQLRQETAARFDLVQQEMRRLEDAQRLLLAQHETGRTQLAQLRTDLAELLAKAQHRENTYAALLDERTGRHRFHRRVLADVVDVLYKKQLGLDDQLRAVDENVTALREGQTAAAARLAELEEGLERNARQERHLSWRLNATEGNSIAKAIQVSTSELIQEVEQLETKLDGKVAEMQTEVARLDVSCSQLTSSVQDVQARQAALPAQTEALRQQVAALSRQQLVARSQLLALQGDVLTLALDQPPAGTALAPASPRDQQLTTDTRNGLDRPEP